jgi:hypothetical protein
MIRASAFALRPDVITRSSEGGLTMNLIMWLMPYGGDRMVGRTKRAGRDEDATVGGEAGDAVNACGSDGFGQGHGWQDGGEVPG